MFLKRTAITNQVCVDVCVRERSECYSNCLISRWQNTEDSLWKEQSKLSVGLKASDIQSGCCSELSTMGHKIRSQLKYRLDIFPKVTISHTPHWSFAMLMFIMILVCKFSLSNNNLTLADKCFQRNIIKCHLYLTFSDSARIQHKQDHKRITSEKPTCWWSTDKLIILTPRFLALTFFKGVHQIYYRLLIWRLYLFYWSLSDYPVDNDRLTHFMTLYRYIIKLYNIKSLWIFFVVYLYIRQWQLPVLPNTRSKSI